MLRWLRRRQPPATPSPGCLWVDHMVRSPECGRALAQIRPADSRWQCTHCETYYIHDTATGCTLRDPSKERGGDPNAKPYEVTETE
jgi:hypothetical protein